MAVQWLQSTLRALWLLSILCSLLLGARLFRLELAHRYRFFLAYLCFDIAQSVVGWLCRADFVFYRNFWRVTEPLTWIFYVLVVLELCSLILKDYHGIHALGRWVVCGSLVISAFLSTLTVLPTWMHSTEEAFSVHRFLMVERGIDFAVVILLLLLLGFLVLFPIQLSRNVIVHSVLYAVFFTTNSMGILIVNLAGLRLELGLAVNTCLMAVAVLCLIGWLTLISRDGENKIMAVRRPVSDDEDRLVSQLKEINAALMRASKRTSPEAFGAPR
jgi:hypothetical protein